MPKSPSAFLLSALQFAGAVLIFLSPACKTRDRSEDPRLNRDQLEAASYVTERGYSYWKPGASSGPLEIEIDLSEQTAYLYQGDKLVGRSRVATGKFGHRTPKGSFEITEKIRRNKRSTLYGKILDASGNVVVADADSRKDSPPPGGRFLGAEMPYWMRITSSGIGMHAGPIPNPGSPASHGCIRMPREMARIVYANAPPGTPVRIVK